MWLRIELTLLRWPHKNILLCNLFQGTRQKSARLCCTLSAGSSSHRNRGWSKCPPWFFIFYKCSPPLWRSQGGQNLPPSPLAQSSVSSMESSLLALGRWHKWGMVCTCLDIRSVNIFCFLKTSILQLGMVEHLKVRQNCHRIEIMIFNLFIRLLKNSSVRFDCTDL